MKPSYTSESRVDNCMVCHGAIRIVGALLAAPFSWAGAVGQGKSCPYNANAIYHVIRRIPTPTAGSAGRQVGSGPYYPHKTWENHELHSRLTPRRERSPKPRGRTCRTLAFVGPPGRIMPTVWSAFAAMGPA